MADPLRSRSGRLHGGAVALLLGMPLLAGCYTPVRGDADRALAIWRSERTATAAGGAEARSGGRPSARRGGALGLEAEEAVALALGPSPRKQARRGRVQVARAHVDQAGQLKNPQLRVGEVRLDELDREDSVEIGLRVPFARPGTLSARQEAAKQGLMAERARFATAELDLAARVLEAHADLWRAQRDLEIWSQAVEIEARREAEVGRRLERHASTRSALALARLELAEARDTLRQRRSDRARAMEALAALLGLPAGQELRALGGRDPLADPWLDRDEAAAVEAALRRRPELRQAAARVREAEALTWLALSKRIPWFDFVQLSYHAGPGASADNWGVLLGVDLPVFSLNSGAVEARRARARRRLAQERDAVRSAVHEVGAALRDARLALGRVKALDRDLLPAARRRVEAVARAVEAGPADPLDLLRAKLRLLRAERRSATARWRLRRALARLRVAVGAPVEDQGSARPRRAAR